MQKQNQKKRKKYNSINRHLSIEQREKIRKRMLGHVVTAETRQKIILKNLGRKQSPETKQNISKAMVKWWKERHKKQQQKQN
jgi:NUMOD3 motif